MIKKFFVFFILAAANFSLLISDPFLVSLFPFLSQGVFLIPFLIYSISKLKGSDLFSKPFFIYLLVVFIFFIFDGLKDIGLLYNLVGTAFLGLVISSISLHKILVPNFLYIYIFISLFYAFAFYLGFWDVGVFSGRATFIGHNENMLAQILCTGFVFCLGATFITKSALRFFYLGIALIFVLPILATVSRTGIAILLLSIILFLLVLLKFSRFNFFATFFFTVFIVVFFIVPILYNNSYFLSFLDRSSEALVDERSELWNRAFSISKENLLFGIGFSNFTNQSWRLNNGLFLVSGSNLDSSYDITAMSIHNSFLDLHWIGGLPLLFSYLYIFFVLFITGVKFMFSKSKAIVFAGAIICSLSINAFLFSITGQGATTKITWFQIGFAYSIIHVVNKKFKFTNF